MSSALANNFRHSLYSWTVSQALSLILYFQYDSLSLFSHYVFKFSRNSGCWVLFKFFFLAQEDFLTIWQLSEERPDLSFYFDCINPVLSKWARDL